ncbi:hypothetical protein [Allomuricauda sp. SCSIO 65647]|uniref:hypothetical protein n=1 Tax=Allomuricauda sp. SCSIO 65647 TaxID=2908843 RepID=UPI001F30087D|nr:hypothetical protein [Muricauda sp. SCSIO 65647]UJH67436.1 hypothetical protein L0P89_15985 [Muricauda sp. SCSIO 65647]
MKKAIKLIGIILGSLLLGSLILLWIKHEPLPKAHTGADADALAKKMLSALNYEAYQNTRFLEWSYRGGRNQYIWDKRAGTVNVEWKDYKVELDLVHLNQSRALKSGEPLTGEKEEKIIQKAVTSFNNDSFWLVAPYKLFDKGTIRSIVKLDNGSKGLLVTYTSGGSTPGDSYLWLLDENGFPNAYKMWVDIIPVGGLKASWDDWIVTESGAFLPKSHKLGPMVLSMGNVKAYN